MVYLVVLNLQGCCKECGVIAPGILARWALVEARYYKLNRVLR